MLIARAPVRIGLAGGGSDLPSYYQKHGGAVINCSINKYFYVIMNVNADNELVITSSDYNTFYCHNSETPLFLDDDLKLPRVVLDYFNLNSSLSLFLASEIPPGTGLGSSSTVTVALIKAISTALNMNISKKELADLACHIEIDILNEPIGKQDQYAASFGGLNFIEFSDKGIKISPLNIPKEIELKLEKNLLLFFTGSSRSASDILEEQTRGTTKDQSDVLVATHAVKEMAYKARDAIKMGDLNTFGRLLHENWVQTKRFSEGVSNTRIDKAYKASLEKGAVGGKITGAGGGGFLMLYCPQEYQSEVIDILEEMDFKQMVFHFEHVGAQVLMNAGLRIVQEDL